MTSSQQHSTVTPLSVIKRRPVGKGAWRMDIEELLNSEQEDLEDLGVLKRELNDLKLLRIVGDLLARKSVRVITLTRLYHYREPDSASNGNGAPRKEGDLP